MNITLIVALVSALFAGAIGYGTAAHFWNVRITEMRLEHANERIAIQRAARANTERLTTKITQAQDEAQRRIADLVRDADRSRVAADGLRDASASAARTADVSPETCSHITATYDIVVSESREFIQSLAADADRCGVERQALNDGWPTTKE